MTTDCPDHTRTEIPEIIAPFIRADALPGDFPLGMNLCLFNLELFSAAMKEPQNAEALQTLLSPQELTLFSGFSYQKRRIEWLGGRLAAKCALCQCFPEWGEWAGISILPQEHGQPGVSVTGQDEIAARVSISHSADFAAALTTFRVDCGVDIQQFSDTLVRVQERFASAEEIMLLAEEPEPVRQLGLLWAAKEAMKKCFFATDPCFFGQIRLVKAKKTGTQLWELQCILAERNPAVAIVQVCMLEQYALAAVVGGAHA